MFYTATLRAGTVLTAMLAIGLAGASGALIDFETLPGGATPTDNQTISTEYAALADGGVSFYYDGDNDGLPDADGQGGYAPMYLEKSGPADGTTDTDPQAYLYDQAGTADLIDPSETRSLGDYLLRATTDVTSRPPFSMIIRYTDAASAFSGEIWDIDGNTSQGTEKWTVEVYASQGDATGSSLITAFDSPEGTFNTAGSLDGKAWFFSFDGADYGNATVEEVRFVFSGTKTTGIGLAFDNFNSTAVPEPATLTLLGAGGVLLIARRRRRG
jgi:hypothetical protein